MKQMIALGRNQGVPGRVSGSRGILFGLLSATLCCVAPYDANAEEAGLTGKTGQTTVGLISDVHFDPFSLTSQPQTVAFRGLREWKKTVGSIIAATKNPDLADKVRSCTGTDRTTTAPIMDGAANFVRQSSPAALVISGDILVQQFECKFRVVFPNATADQYREFAIGTARFVLWKFKRAARNRPVLFALGNHDSGCGNYRRDRNDAFLSGLAADVGMLASASPRERRRITSEFRTLGSYHYSGVAGINGLDAIVIDTSPLSRKAEGCGKSTPVDPSAIITWTHNELAEAKASGRHVWIVGHIPPGLDVRASIGPAGDVGAPVRFYSDSSFDDLLTGYAQTIGLAVFGHTHMDEFRHPGGVLIKIVPAVSPGSGNDPAAVIATLTPQGSVADYSVFRGSITNYNERWLQFYRFDQAYSSNGFNNDSLRKLNMNSEDGIKYRKNYFIGPISGNFLTSEPAWTAYYSAYFQNAQ